ncbi:MAG: hypothetical protein RBR02_06415 [Desulfuromonadaceae bacterium]|nr:hypothetical protein [Desulfuromonadaceae bacterium]
MKKVIFDFEVYPNWWCVSYTEPDDFNTIVTVTSDNEQAVKILDELRYGNLLIGFNIKYYDLKIYNAVIRGLSPQTIYKLSKNIISKETPHFLNNYEYWNKFNFYDLIDDWLKGSLKQFEANFGLSIEECPVPFDKEFLTQEEKELIIGYCNHDIYGTTELFKYRQNDYDAKVALAEVNNIPVNEALKRNNGSLLAEILGGQGLNFPQPTTFTIPERVKPYVEKHLPKEILKLFVKINGNKKEVRLFDNDIVYGVGGIHSTYSENLLVKRKEGMILENRDVEAYYPNMDIIYEYISRNAKYPEKFKDIVSKSSTLKKEGKKKERAPYKLASNSAYGVKKSKFNKLKDPYNASNTCYLGQILLSALSNQLYTEVPNLKIIQTNTDGVLLYYPEQYKDLVQYIVTEWEKTTGLVMETDPIKIFFQRDVNNYIELNMKDKIKLKGKWANQADEDRPMTNLNAIITHEALLNYYLKGKPIRETIYECNDLLKFCFTTKMGGSYEDTIYFMNEKKHIVNKVNRVVATTDKKKGTLKKVKYLSKYTNFEEYFDYILENTNSKKTEEELRKQHLKTFEKGLKDREDKIAEIPEHCLLVNGELKDIPKELDREWYVAFAENKLVELKEV